MPKAVLVKLHQTIRKVTTDLDGLSYNTAIAALMELLNTLRSVDSTSRFIQRSLLAMIAPFAPHLAEEIWHEALGETSSVFKLKWPQHDEAMTIEDEVEIAIQINGKVRGRLMVATGMDAKSLEQLALDTDAVKSQLESGGTVRKVVAVPGRLVNVIIG
jgi:leucyl-tRNA synthetase